MKEELKYWYLRNHKLFEQLTNEEIDSLGLISSYKEGNKNDHIFFSDTDKKRLYTIKEGTLKICHRDKEGKEVITELLTENDIFGYINIADTAPDQVEEYAKVLTDKIRICSFEIDKFKILLQKHPDLSLKYSSLINEKLVSFRQKYSDLIFKDVHTRIADFFKRYATHHAKKVNDSLEMEMVLTHQEIADYTASSRQSVTSSINKLADEGKLIYQGRKKVIIPDITKL